MLNRVKGKQTAGTTVSKKAPGVLVGFRAHYRRSSADGVPHTVRADARPVQEEHGARAQNFAQDSNAALETYKRQVRALEEQLACSDDLYAPPISLPLLHWFCAAWES